MIVNLGMFGTGMSISLEQLVMDSEMCRIVKRFQKGIKVNENTIALDTITSVGIRGMYLMEDHTIEHLRSGEHTELEISNGANYDVWMNKGAKSSQEKARDLISKILEKGNKCLLDKEHSKALSKIIGRYEKRIVGKKLS